MRFSEPVATGRFVREAGLDFKRGWAGLVAGTRLDTSVPRDAYAVPAAPVKITGPVRHLLWR